MHLKTSKYCISASKSKHLNVVDRNYLYRIQQVQAPKSEQPLPMLRAETFLGIEVKKLVGGTALAIFLLSGITVIDFGSIGIQQTLGSSSILNPGVHFVPPLVTHVSRFTTKIQLLEQSNFVPTKEGLTVELDTAM